MDRDTVSAITHGDMPLANPLAPRDLDAAIAELTLPPGATAIDVGCGNGEVLARVKAAHHYTTMGIEPSERWAAHAHDASTSSTPRRSTTSRRWRARGIS